MAAGRTGQHQGAWLPTVSKHGTLRATRALSAAARAATPDNGYGLPRSAARTAYRAEVVRRPTG